MILVVPLIIIDEILVSSGGLLNPYLMTTQSQTLIKNLKEGDDVITNNVKICNTFNDYYVNVTNDIGEDECVDLNGPLSDIVNIYVNHPSILAIKENLVDSGSNFECHAVNNDVLFKKLTSLKSNKAYGFDGQPPKLIKIGAPVLQKTYCQ